MNSQVKRYLGQGKVQESRKHRSFCPHELGCTTLLPYGYIHQQEACQILLFKGFLELIQQPPSSLRSMGGAESSNFLSVGLFGDQPRPQTIQGLSLSHLISINSNVTNNKKGSCHLGTYQDFRSTLSRTWSKTNMFLIIPQIQSKVFSILFF